MKRFRLHIFLLSAVVLAISKPSFTFAGVTQQSNVNPYQFNDYNSFFSSQSEQEHRLILLWHRHFLETNDLATDFPTDLASGVAPKSYLDLRLLSTWRHYAFSAQDKLPTLDPTSQCCGLRAPPLSV